MEPGPCLPAGLRRLLEARARGPSLEQVPRPAEASGDLGRLYYAYNLGPSVAENGITGRPENVLLHDYSVPVLAPNLNTPHKVHGMAEFALQIQNGSAV